MKKKNIFLITKKDIFILTIVMLVSVISAFISTGGNPYGKLAAAPWWGRLNISSFNLVSPVKVSGRVLSNKVFLTIPAGFDLSTMVPNVVVSNGATLTPSSGVAQNFNSPVTYRVSKGSVAKTYTVTATVSPSSWAWLMADSSGGQSCAAHGGVCTLAYSYTGEAQSCDTVIIQGSSICNITGVGAAWSQAGGSFTGNAACAGQGSSTCVQVYDAGYAFDCGRGLRSGTALCAKPTGIGARIGPGTSGNYACTMVGAKCVTAYDIFGVVQTCTTQNPGASSPALCSKAIGGGFSLDTGKTGQSFCSVTRKKCLFVVDNGGNPQSCTTFTNGGAVICSK